jgi:membrane-associated phospholipid phosphatase
MTAVVLAYFLARGASDARPAEAMAQAARLIEFERTLGIFRERALQQMILGSTAIVDLANWTYIFGHWPVIATTFVWLAVKHRERLPRYRNAIIISGAVGILVFLVYPVTPPRLMQDYGFVDTVELRSRAYRVLQPASMTDLYASMPSLHVGWNLIMGIALIRESSHVALRTFGALMPVVMFAAVVLTANHYFIDVIAGVALVIASLRLADWIADRH